MRRFFKVLALVAVMVISWAGVHPTAQAGDLPDQLVKFLPASPDILVVVPSVKELDRAWNEMRTIAAEMSTEGDEPLPSLDEWFMSAGAEIYQMIDQGRPLALAASIPNMMAGQEPVFSGILPIKDGDWDLNSLAAKYQLPTVVRDNGYLLVSQTPEFVPAAVPTDLLDHLPSGALMLCADMANLWTNFSPLLDVGLMAMNAPPAATDEDAGPSEPEMTSEQTAAMGDMVRNVMQSADVLAMGLDLRDSRMFFTEEFTVLAGTPFDPPAQPDFKQALELSRYLPRRADWAMSYAIEMGGILELYKEFYLATLEMQYAELKDESGFDLAEFVDIYFKSLDLVMVPTAMTIDLDHKKINAQYVMKTPDVQAIVDMQNQLMEVFNQEAPVLAVNPIEGLKIDGHKVYAWDYDWNLEALMAMAGPTAESKSPEDQAEEMELAGSLLQDFIPGIRMAHKDDLLFASLGTELDPVSKMLKLAKQKRGAVHPELAKLAHQAGPNCQGVFQGDLGAILTMAFEIAEEISGEDMPALNLDPMPMTYALRIGDLSYGVDYQIGLKGLARFIAAMEELEDQED